MGFLEDRDLSNEATIPEFYKGKTIFITGGSGFIGKILIEKLLYSCPELDRIYLLLRSKKGVSAEDRLGKIYDLPCFDRLRSTKPNIFQSKVFVVAGDVSESGMGLSDEDRTLLVNRVNIIFHVAASVRYQFLTKIYVGLPLDCHFRNIKIHTASGFKPYFLIQNYSVPNPGTKRLRRKKKFDDTLTFSAKLNLFGTKQITDFANEIRDLSAFVHVSTSYSNTNRDPVEEVMYDAHADWRDTLDICQTMDEHTIRMFTPKYLGEIPNTYTFTKQLAEHVVYEQRGKLPAVIIRPSIVIASIEEPVPAWVENFNGPVGIFVACGKGIMRSIHTNDDIVLDFMPVDSCVRHIIAAAWIRGTKKLEPEDDISIYNCCSGKLRQILMSDLVAMSKRVAANVPLNDALWSTGGTITPNYTLHYFKVLLQHLLPAVMVDMLLWLLGKKTMLVKVQRRIYTANLALSYYTTQQWTFSNDNFVSLRSKLKEEDKEQFYYELENMDEVEYFEKCCYGGRRYLLKEKDEDLPKARTHHRRMIIIDRTVKAIFYGCVLWWIWNRHGYKIYELIV